MIMFNPGACCSCPPPPTGTAVTVSLTAPCAFVPGDSGTILIKRNGSVVATAPWSVPTSGVFWGGVSAAFNLPSGSGYTAEFESAPARFVKRAPFAFTVPIFGPATRSGQAADVHPDYVCFPRCRETSGPVPPLPKTLHITDSVWGETTLAYTIGSGAAWFEGVKGISIGICGCPTLGASVTYRWPSSNTGPCALDVRSKVRASDLCFADAPTPENPVLFTRVGGGTATTVSAWPLLVTATFDAPSCDWYTKSNHMPYPGGVVSYEITE